MQFLDELDEEQSAHVSTCNAFLKSPERLKALYETGLMDTPREEVFDRLCRLAANILNVPLTIVSLVDDTRQFFKADYGLPHPFSETRTLPIDFSLCRYTMAGDTIISGNAQLDPFLKIHPSTGPWGISALIVLPLITPDGHVLGTFCCIQPTPRDWTDLDLEVMRELTASIMTEINLRNKVIKLQKEQNLRDTFITALSHDLRTPLTATKLQAQTLLKKFPENMDIETIVARMTKSLGRAESMIQNLLDANLIRSGTKLSLKTSLCDLNEIIDQSVKELSLIYGERFRVEMSSDLKISADPEAVRRMVDNLVSNAGKYSEFDSEILVTALVNETHFKFSVKNKGNPISEEDQKSIFEPFHRTIDATQGNQKGWGLGLPLVRGLAEAHNGKVYVMSSAESGTEFTIELPLTDPDTSPHK